MMRLDNAIERRNFALVPLAKFKSPFQYLVPLGSHLKKKGLKFLT